MYLSHWYASLKTNSLTESGCSSWNFLLFCQLLIAIFSPASRATGMTLSTQAAAVSSGNAQLCCIFSRPPSVLCKVQGVSQESLAELAVIREWLSGPQGSDVCPSSRLPHWPFHVMQRWSAAASQPLPSLWALALAGRWMNVTAPCVAGGSSR